MSDENSKPEPQNFGDLTMQPTGSGPADLESRYMEAALDGAAADISIEAGVADASSAPHSVIPTEGGRDAEESAAQPS